MAGTRLADLGLARLYEPMAGPECYLSSFRMLQLLQPRKTKFGPATMAVERVEIVVSVWTMNRKPSAAETNNFKHFAMLRDICPHPHPDPLSIPSAIS